MAQCCAEDRRSTSLSGRSPRPSAADEQWSHRRDGVQPGCWSQCRLDVRSKIKDIASIILDVIRGIGVGARYRGDFWIQVDTDQFDRATMTLSPAPHCAEQVAIAAA